MFYQYGHFGLSEYFRKERGKDFSFPKHIHRSFELVAVLSGHMTACIGAEEYPLERGEAVMIFPDQPHSLTSEESEHVLFIFSPDAVSAYYAPLVGARPKSNRIKLPEWLLARLDELEEDCTVVERKAALYSVCAILDKTTDYVKKEHTESKLLGRIFDYIEQNYDKDCSLEAISRELGCSGSYLSRYFKHATEMSYVFFVNRYRISRACHLLTNTDKTILECSMDCGYATLRSFNRNFKEHVGLSPKEYRDSAKNG